jgi:hypothetical protein
VGKAVPKGATPVKAEVREKRTVVRAKCRGKRGAVRKAAGMAVLLLSMCFAFGCATATPASKAQGSTSKGNTVSVTVILGGGTNCVVGDVAVTVSDAIGTQVQSADAGRDDTTGQSASPANTSGLNGDKAIEGVADTVQAGLTGGGTAVLKKGKAAISGGDKAAPAAPGAGGGAITPPPLVVKPVVEVPGGPGALPPSVTLKPVLGVSGGG